MNLYTVLDTSEKELLEKVIKIENRDYTKDEIRKIEYKTVDYIMSNSKNNIDMLRMQYSGVLDKLESYI